MSPPRGIKRQQSVTPVRKSARLQEKERLFQQSEIQEQLLQLPSPTSTTPDKEVRSIRSLGIRLHPTDSGQSVHRNQSTLPVYTESGSGVKSLDKITNLRPKELPVPLAKPRSALPKNVNESHLQIVLLKAQHLQIFRVTPRTTTASTPSSVGSKKEAGLEHISRQTAA